MAIDVGMGDQIKVAFFTFFFQENISFAFAFNLSFFGPRLDIASLFLSVLAELVS